MRDEKKLLIHLRKIPEPNEQMSSESVFDDFECREKIQERRSRQPSFIGECDSIADAEASFDLPSHAWDLPRPHLTCAPRSHLFDAKKRMDPLDLSFWEFMTESMRLLNRLLRSTAHSEVAKEYVDYLEFLTTRNVDYNEKAVMLFDNDFRNRAAHERLCLSDNETRRCIADRYFHATQRREQPST